MAQIRGWKGICKYLGFSEISLKRWHYNLSRIPFTKSVNSQRGKITIEEPLLKAWYKDLIALRQG